MRVEYVSKEMAEERGREIEAILERIAKKMEQDKVKEIEMSKNMVLGVATGDSKGQAGVDTGDGKEAEMKKAEGQNGNTNTQDGGENK